MSFLLPVIPGRYGQTKVPRLSLARERLGGYHLGPANSRIDIIPLKMVAMEDQNLCLVSLLSEARLYRWSLFRPKAGTDDFKRMKEVSLAASDKIEQT